MEINLLVFRAKHAVKHFFKAVNAHGLHSPFMFSLYCSCFKPRGSRPYKNAYKAAFKLLSAFYQSIPMQNIQSVGAITKVVQTSPGRLLKQTRLNAKYSVLLGKMVNHLSLIKGLELGTSVGLSTVFLSAYIKDWETVEGNPDVYNWFQAYLDEYPSKNVKAFEANFDDFFSSNNQIGAFDFVFIDGDHTLEATLANVESVKPLLSNNALVVLDDIAWSEEMYRAWEIIKQDSFFGYTAETNRLGFLFKRDVHVKQHFFLRY